MGECSSNTGANILPHMRLLAMYANHEYSPVLHNHLFLDYPCSTAVTKPAEYYVRLPLLLHCEVYWEL